MKKNSKPVIVAIICFLLIPGYSFGQTAVYDLLLKVSVLRAEGDTTGALALLNGVSEIKTDYRLCLEKGEIYLATGNLKSAKDEFLKASDIVENSGSFGLARVYATTGEAAMAIRFLEQNLQSRFRINERRLMTDSHIHRIDNSTQWRLFWSNDIYSEEESFLSEVEYLISIGKNGDAYSMTQKVSDGSESWELVYSKALAAYSSGEYPLTIKLLSAPSASTVPEAERNRLLAGSNLALKNYRQASLFYSKMIADEVIEPAIFIGRAMALSGMSENKRSQADIDYYLKLAPDDDKALRLAAEVSASSGDRNSALIYLNHNVEANPGSREAFLSRGELWFSIRMWDHAVSDYSMALDLDPVDSELWLKKGISLLNSGRTEDACHDFYVALRLGNRKAAEYINKSCIK